MKRPGRAPFPMPEDVAEWLLANLQEHRFLSLGERVKLVLQKFGYASEKQRLRRFYIRQGVYYLNAKKQMRKACLRTPAKRKERSEFVERFVSLAIRNEPMVIMDETSVNIWSRSKTPRTWMGT